MHRIINDSKSLELFLEQLKQDEFVAIDTEFMREKTYYPQVCLIQVAGENASAAIDPLAKDMDLSAFYKLLADKKIVKVFHACRQDIEIFYN
ncbi:MAG: ribonuclease D, partial [Pseudomonadota bacterium]